MFLSKSKVAGASRASSLSRGTKASSRRRRRARIGLERLEERRLLVTAGLVGHWPLDVQLLTGGPRRYPDVFGSNDLEPRFGARAVFEDSELGRAVKANGSEHLPRLSDASEFGLQDEVSASIWMRPDNVQQGGYVLSIANGVQLDVEGNELRFSVQTSTHQFASEETTVAVGNFDFQDDHWYHIAGTFDGSQLKAYVNGNEVASATVTRGSLVTNGEMLLGLGNQNGPLREFRGALDDAKLFSRALTAAEVTQLSNDSSALESPDDLVQYDPSGEPALIAPNLSMYTKATSLTGGSLTFEALHLHESDVFGIKNTNQINRDGDKVFFQSPTGSVEIASVSTSSNNRIFVLRFSSAITAESVQALGRAVTYESTASDPPTHERGVLIHFAEEQGNGPFVDEITIEYGSTGSNVQMSPSEGNTVVGDVQQVIVDPNLVFESGIPDFDGATLNVTFIDGSGTENDVLRPSSSEGIIATGGVTTTGVLRRPVDGAPAIVVGTFENGSDTTPLTINLNGQATPEAIQAILRAITFGFSTNSPRHTRQIQFEFSFGDTDLLAIKQVSFEDDGGGNGGNTGGGGGGNNSNQAPIINFSDVATQFEEGLQSEQILSEVAISDPDSPDFDTGEFNVAITDGAVVGDALSIAGSRIAVENNAVFDVSTGSRVQFAELTVQRDLELRFALNNQANPTRLNELALSILFSTVEEPLPGFRTITFSLKDGDGGRFERTKRVNVVGVNDPPVLEVTRGAAEYVEGQTPVAIDPGLVISDVDSTDFDGGQLTAFFPTDEFIAGDFLTISVGEELDLQGSSLFIMRNGTQLEIAEASIGRDEIVVDFGAGATIADVQLVGRAIAFGNELEEISGGDRLVMFEVRDPNNASDEGSRLVHVGDTNDAPRLKTENAVEFTLGGESILVAPESEVIDADSVDLDTGYILVQLSESALQGDSISLELGEGFAVNHSDVFVLDGSQTFKIGERTDGANGSIRIDFTSRSTPEIAEAIIRQFRFHSTSSVAGNREVEFEIADGDGGLSTTLIEIVIAPLPDVDSDGADDQLEQQAPNGGDGNSDGIADDEQALVASFRGTTDRFITIDAGLATELSQVQASAHPSPDDAPAEVQFPVGFFDFVAQTNTSDESLVVTIYLEPGISANSYYMFGPTPDNSTPHWYAFTYNGETGAKIFADRIELHFRDGQRGDSDLLINGSVADPGAPAVSEHPWQNTDDPEDVNNDGQTTPFDALLGINSLAADGVRDLEAFPRNGRSISNNFYDVSGDGRLTTFDVLSVINRLSAEDRASRNANQPAQSEFIQGHDFWDRDDDERRTWDEAVYGVAIELNA